ncbi:DUF6440 family protein (plasmid) [Brevibacillus halotolerans]|nr:DUF6440 family protein [Brevibacillus halotolerans]
MKKRNLLFIILAFVMLTGCSSVSSADGIEEQLSNRFVRTEWSRHQSMGQETNFNYVIVDKETKVQYLAVTTGYAGSISVTPLIDENGKPLIKKDLESKSDKN